MNTSDKLAKTIGSKPANPPATKPSTIFDLLRMDATQSQLKLALPKTLTPERLTRIVMTEIRKNPVLMTCEKKSFLGAVMQAAQLGLEPGSALGHCYLIPFNNRNKGVTEAQLILGYRGMLDLARRSGQIVSINAYVVKEGDEFKYCLGLHPDIYHVPSPDADRSLRPTIFAYAVAILKGGGYQFCVMSRAEIESIRNNSANYAYAKNKGSTIWARYFDDMAQKTVIRRMFKYLPVSIETMYQVEVDERRDRGETITEEDLTDIDVATFNMDESQVEDGEVVETPTPAPEKVATPKRTRTVAKKDDKPPVIESESPTSESDDKGGLPF